MPLTPKQQRFIEEYLVDLNATQAAIRAGYSKKTARVTGAENLTKPAVAAAIAEARSKLTKRVEITQDYVLAGLKREAEYEGKGASHSARVQAHGLLAKHLGMLTDKLEVNQQAKLVVVEEIVDAGDRRKDRPAPPGPG